MQREKFRESNSLIKIGLLLEMIACTVWKFSSSLSVELIGYALLEIALALAGVFALIYGLRKSGLEEDTQSRLYQSHAKSQVWAELMAVFFPIFHLFYIASQVYERASWWNWLMIPVDEVGNYSVGLNVSFVLIMMVLWYLLSDLLERIRYTAESLNMETEKSMAVRLFWWRRWVIGGGIAWYIFLSVMGHSRSIWIESGLLSVFYLLLHWGYGMGIWKVLDRLEQPVPEDMAKKSGGRQHLKWDRAALVVWGTAWLILIASSVRRFSSAKDFLYIDYNDEKIILTEYIGDRSQVKVPEYVNGKQVVGLSGSFTKNKKLCKVWLPEGIQWLAEGTFAFCENLKEIELPGSFNLLGNKCFVGSGLEKVYLKEDHIQRVGQYAFYNTPFELFLNRHSEDGRVMLGKTMLRYSGNGEESDALHIVGEVEVIADCAFAEFSNRRQLRELYLPSGLKTLEADTLTFLNGLKDLHVPDSVQYIHVNNFSERPDDFVVWGKTGSEAERMARQMGVHFAEEGQPRPVEYKRGSSKDKEE